MGFRQKSVYSACFLLHFLLVVTISCRDTLWLAAHKLTILPPAFGGPAEKAESIASAALGQDFASSNPLRRGLLTYFHIAGIDRGYGYFAPNVPESYKLVFELHYADGRVEYALPGVSSDAAGLRVASLLDEIGRTRYDAVREYLVRTMTRSIWREHRDVTMIRAVFGVGRLPTITEFGQGKRGSYEFLHAYDFTRPAESVEPQEH